MKALTLREKDFLRKNGGSKLEVTYTKKHYVLRGQILGAVATGTVSSMLKKGYMRHDTERECFVPTALALVEAGVELLG